MSFVIDKTVNDKPPKKRSFRITGKNSSFLSFGAHVYFPIFKYCMKPRDFGLLISRRLN